jgi:hypothetical protein
MTNPDSPTPKRNFAVQALQVAVAWACGSVIMGTVALLFLASERPVVVQPESGRSPFISCPAPIILGQCGSGPSPFDLTPVERLGVFVLVAGLFVALGALVWRTAAATWLAGDTRARLLWAAVVGAGGLAGWSFAAVLTFDVGFSSARQLILAYTCGGLPFGLVAGMLLRPWRANVAALALSAVLLAAGLVMVAGRTPPYPYNLFAIPR